MLPWWIGVALALGARTMVRRNALIRHLPAVETLGSVTFICADKTGTLTENRMRATRFFTPEAGLIDQIDSQAPRLLQAMALNNDAYRDENGRIVGDPTEVALLERAMAAGTDRDQLQKTMRRVAELPFDSERALMTTIHISDDGYAGYTKGAPEQILGNCQTVWRGGAPTTIDREELLGVATQMAAQGFRVLGFAFRSIANLSEVTIAQAESDLTFLGFVGLIDPPREEAVPSSARA